MATAGLVIVGNFSSAGSPSYGHWRARVQTGFAILLIGLGLSWISSGAQARALKLVALGDSLTTSLGLPTDEAFPARLQAALKAKGLDVEVIDAGVSGDTAADGLARYDWSVPGDADAMILELGANDMLRGLSPEDAKAALAAILERAKQAHLPVLIAGVRAAPNLGPDYIRRFEAIYPDLAKSYGAALCPFFLDGVAGDPKLNQPDGEHPTPAGVDIIVARILPAVENPLNQVKP